MSRLNLKLTGRTLAREFGGFRRFDLDLLSPHHAGMECEKTKVCTKCGEAKAVGEYAFWGGRFLAQCRQCKSEVTRKYRELKRPNAILRGPRKNRRVVDGKVLCTKCRVVKDTVDFHKKGSHYASHCMSCRSAFSAAKYARNSISSREKSSEAYRRLRESPGWKDKARSRKLHAKYGLSLQEFGAMVERQENKCAICGMVGDENKCGMLYVDHCHNICPSPSKATVEQRRDSVRGLLCSKCNIAVEALRESAENADSLAAYLIYWQRKHAEKTDLTQTPQSR